MNLPDIIEGYEERKEQLEMAEAVGSALEKSENLLVEAGTGVGKTLAYLIPAAEWAIANKKRVIVATYSKALQSQIFEKDLPVVSGIFPKLKFDIMFGGENYFCYKKEKELGPQENLFGGGTNTPRTIEAIKSSGGIKENVKSFIPPDVWDAVKREKYRCSEEACHDFKRCFYWQKRRKLSKAHIIVVNHHLFFGDLLVKRTLLPQASAVVFDEAHKLEEVMRSMFSRRFSSFAYIRLIKELEDFLKKDKKRTKKAYTKEKTMLKAASGEFKNFIYSIYDDGRINLKEGGSVLFNGSAPYLEAPDIREALKGASAVVRAAAGDADEKEMKNYCDYLLDSVESHAETIEMWAARREKDYFYWLEEERGKNMNFFATPYDLKRDFEENIFYNYESVIMTSATLCAGDDFAYIKARFGLEDAPSLELKSPFDFKARALLYLEKQLPPPQDLRYPGALASRLSRIIESAGGNMLVLFTSIELMKKTKEALEPSFPSIPFLMQGSAPPMALIEEFRREPSVLFATLTFWQGIDIKGDDLRCVVITRLPFEVPAHPMQKAVYSHINELGGNDFAEIALPRAIFMLKQGFGRLIRSKDDYGAVMILDTRIVTKPYGRRFLAALPDASITHSVEDTAKFISDIQKFGYRRVVPEVL